MKITSKLISSSNKVKECYLKEKYNIKISEEIEIFTDESIIDISVS